MKKQAVILGLVVALVPALAAGEVYKWKDRNGKIQYSDRPPPGVSYTTLSGKGVPAVAPAPAAESPQGAAAPAAGPGNGAAPRLPSEEELAKAAEAKKLQEERLALEQKMRDLKCRNAKSRAAQFEQGGRIYNVDEKGERHYYGDQEMAEELAKARAEVEQYCEQ